MHRETRGRLLCDIFTREQNTNRRMNTNTDDRENTNITLMKYGGENSLLHVLIQILMQIQIQLKHKDKEGISETDAKEQFLNCIKTRL